MLEFDDSTKRIDDETSSISPERHAVVEGEMNAHLRHFACFASYYLNGFGEPSQGDGRQRQGIPGSLLLVRRQGFGSQKRAENITCDCGFGFRPDQIAGDPHALAWRQR